MMKSTLMATSTFVISINAAHRLAYHTFLYILLIQTRLEIVKNMTPRNRDAIITEKQVINSKIPNERVLSFALNLGMISREQYDCMKAIGKSKRVGELMKEMSINSIDTLTPVLRKMLRRGMIAIVEDKPSSGDKPARPAPLSAENEKEAEEANEEAHHVEDNEEDSDALDEDERAEDGKNDNS
jgi:hypothetical protein